MITRKGYRHGMIIVFPPPNYFFSLLESISLFWSPPRTDISSGNLRTFSRMICRSKYFFMQHFMKTHRSVWPVGGKSVGPCAERERGVQFRVIAIPAPSDPFSSASRPSVTFLSLAWIWGIHGATTGILLGRRRIWETDIKRISVRNPRRRSSWIATATNLRRDHLKKLIVVWIKWAGKGWGTSLVNLCSRHGRRVMDNVSRSRLPLPSTRKLQRVSPKASMPQSLKASKSGHVQHKALFGGQMRGIYSPRHTQSRGWQGKQSIAERLQVARRSPGEPSVKLADAFDMASSCSSSCDSKIEGPNRHMTDAVTSKLNDDDWLSHRRILALMSPRAHASLDWRMGFDETFR